VHRHSHRLSGAFRAIEGWLGNVDPEGGRIRELLVQPERFTGGVVAFARW